MPPGRTAPDPPQGRLERAPRLVRPLGLATHPRLLIIAISARVRRARMDSPTRLPCALQPGRRARALALDQLPRIERGLVCGLALSRAGTRRVRVCDRRIAPLRRRRPLVLRLGAARNALGAAAPLAVLRAAARIPRQGRSSVALHWL